MRGTCTAQGHQKRRVKLLVKFGNAEAGTIVRAELRPDCGASLKADDLGRLCQLVIVHDLNQIGHPAQRQRVGPIPTIRQRPLRWPAIRK
jgi:hypothetical protein